ncbi:MAG TPA: ferritin-like domain-containing protein, partial [Labilithrix sp.]|nr:ferritin-like domain-containing protein [Labilithrix sp.]
WAGQNGELVGTMCARAADKTACLAKVQGFRLLPPTREACAAKYPADVYTGVDCSTSYILYTRGTEIGVARTNDEIKALISTFDTLGEALWAASVAGYSRSCSGGYDSLPDSEYRQTPDGGWDLSLIAGQCNEDLFKVLVHVDYAGNVTIISKEAVGQRQSCPVAGRRPAGFRSEEAPATATPIGEHFAGMATLEAASVTAFRHLHRQLRAHGAPRELLNRIRKAARDEIRHARATGALARKYGVTPSAPQIAASSAGVPSLFAIARENAREGCVRETYGALVAHLQKTRAADDDVRETMLAIADEETEHAALSWDIAAWIETKLGDAERAELATERRMAFASLAGELTSAVDPQIQRVSGVPDAREALRMLEGLGPMMLAA